MITELRLRNFKSWKGDHPIALSRVVGLFGSNSSGKTSLLQALLLLQQTAESRDRTQPLAFGGEQAHVQLGSFVDVVYFHDTERDLGLGMSWEPPDGLSIANPETEGTELFHAKVVDFDTQLSVGRNYLLRVDEFCYNATGNRVRFSHDAKGRYAITAFINGSDDYLRRTRGRAWPLPSPVKCYGFPDQVSGYYQNAGFVGELELEFEQQLGRLYYLGPLRSNPRRQYNWAGSQPRDVGDSGQQAVEALLASRLRGKVNHRQVNRLGHPIKKITVEVHVAQWLKMLNLIHEFVVEPVAEGSDIFRVQVRRSPDGPLVLLTDVGFGVSQILPVLVLLAYVPSGSTVILEQPEIHLHPAVQAGLADAILEAASMRNVQVVVESHSEHLLRRLQLRVAQGQYGPDMFSLYFCSLREGSSEIEDLQLNLFGGIENWPRDFFGDPFTESAMIAQEGLRRQIALS